MGLGIWRKIKEGFKKAGAWIKNKAVPWLKNKGIGIAKTVWGAAKPFVGMLPAGGAITTAIDTGLGIGEKLINTANDFANTGNVNNAVQQVKETVSPFIKLKKGGGGNAPVMGIGSPAQQFKHEYMDPGLRDKVAAKMAALRSVDPADIVI